MAIDYNPGGRPRRDSQMQDLARLHGSASTQRSMERQPNYFSDSKTPDPDGERDTASLSRTGVGEHKNRYINDPSGNRTNRG